MPVRELVVTMSEEPRERECAISQLSIEPRLKITRQYNEHLAVVVDAATNVELEELSIWLQDMEGIVEIELASN